MEHTENVAQPRSGAGKLWGVGIGPGDPELLTLKAVRILRQADVIMLPDSNGAEKTALNIVRAYLEGKTLLFAEMPMVRDRAVMDRAHEQAAGQICALLDQGRQVAFVTLGDPSIYSTYMYLHEKVRRQGYPVEVVPGVPSFCAAAARLNRSLCQGGEPLLVIPASHDQEALLDVPANKVFMKAGRSILDLQQLLGERGLLERASMVENCGMENERICRGVEEIPDDAGYYSLIIARERAKTV